MLPHRQSTWTYILEFSKMEAACFAATSVLTLKPICRQNQEVYCLKSNVHAYYCISLFI